MHHLESESERISSSSFSSSGLEAEALALVEGAVIPEISMAKALTKTTMSSGALTAEVSVVVPDQKTLTAFGMV